MSHSRSMTTDVARKYHTACVVCGREGLDLRFILQPDGSVLGTFDCAAEHQGYEGRLHGGVIATLLDAAMTHCLFSRGIVAFTAKLEVTFRHPIQTGRQAIIRAWIEGDTRTLYEMRAELLQTDRVCAVALGLFAPAESSQTGNGTI